MEDACNPSCPVAEPRKVIKVLFGIPNEGHTECEAYDNRMEMMAHLGALQVVSSLGRRECQGTTFEYPVNTQIEVAIATVGQVMVQLAREHLAKMAVEGGFDYLFMVDDDMLCPKNLLELLLVHDKDMVAALAFTRSYPHMPVIYNLEQGYDQVRHTPYKVNTPVLTYPKDKLVRCDAVGFGSVLIKREVLLSIPEPRFMSTTGAGEDILFCWKAGEAGKEVYMDTSVKLGHLGYPKCITEETYEEVNNLKDLRGKYGDQDKYS